MCKFCKNYDNNRIFGANIPIQKCANETNLTSARISRNTSRENIEKKIQSAINANILRLVLTRTMLLIAKQSLIQEAIIYVAKRGVLRTMSKFQMPENVIIPKARVEKKEKK